MCYYPKLIQNKKYTPNKKNGGVLDWDYMYTDKFDKRVLTVPIGCGNCEECRKNKARDWQVRLLEDVRHNENGKFITLTFSDESIRKLAKEVTEKTTRVRTGVKKEYKDKNGKIRKRYKYQTITEKIELNGYDTDNAIATYGTRKFLERWRKKHGKSLRHWFITELGHKGTQNVHMHGIVWTNEDVRELEKAWDYGFIWIGERRESGKIVNYVTEKTVNYITKYVQKVDFEHRYYKPKILTSAGIGAGYMKRSDVLKNKFNGENTNESYTTKTGHKIKLPIYFRNKIYSDEEREKLWIIKLNQEIRWVGGEQVSVKDGYEEYWGVLEHYRKRNQKLGYGTSTIDWSQKQYEEELRNLLIQSRITRSEKNAPQALRGLGIAPESAESCYNRDSAIIWGQSRAEKTIWNDDGEPDWVWGDNNPNS